VATLRFAECAPVVLGVKITKIAQLASAGNSLRQVLDTENMLELVPAIDRPVMLKAAAPVFVKVTEWAALGTPTVTFPKAMLAGDRVTDTWLCIELELSLLGLTSKASIVKAAQKAAGVTSARCTVPETPDASRLYAWVV